MSVLWIIPIKVQLCCFDAFPPKKQTTYLTLIAKKSRKSKQIYNNVVFSENSKVMLHCCMLNMHKVYHSIAYKYHKKDFH